MPSTKTVWGIDVGQCALKALKVQWRDDKLRALAFDVIEHPKILSQPDADEQQLIRSALGKFLSRNSVVGSTVVISVPGQASFTRFIKLPPVEQRKIPEIVRYEARQQIPFNLEDVVWDYQTISAASAGPREVEVGIFAMKRDIIADYVSDFLAMKIEPDIVQMAPVALYNFLRYDKHEGSGTTILIDVGAESTNLVVAEGDRVWIRPVPLGGNNFTQALCKAFKLSFSKAENLKRHAAESKHARKVFQAMRPVFSDLLTEIQRSIGYYTSLYRDSRIERVIALGGAFRLAGLKKFIAQSLGVEVETLEGFNSLGDSEALSAPLFRENVLSFGVAFGLAVQGLGVGTIRTSLLPPEILNQKILRKKRPYFIAAAAMLIGAIACFGYDQVLTKAELRGDAGEVETINKTVDRIAEENANEKDLFDEQKTVLAEEQQKVAELKGLVAYQDCAYDLLRTVWEAVPRDERAETWDPRQGRPRASLEMIELLSLTMHYVPDVRAHSQMLKGAGGGVAVISDGASPAAGLGAAGIGGAEPGLLVRIIGITPKTGRDGHEFVTNALIEKLRDDPRTVSLQTPAGVEKLASIKLTGLFRNARDYPDFDVRSEARSPGDVEPGPRTVDKGNDFWFEAEWVVRVPEHVESDVTEGGQEEMPTE